jgi:hypothetical protein
MLPGPVDPYRSGVGDLRAYSTNSFRLFAGTDVAARNRSGTQAPTETGTKSSNVCRARLVNISDEVVVENVMLPNSSVWPSGVALAT